MKKKETQQKTKTKYKTKSMKLYNKTYFTILVSEMKLID